MRDSWVRCALLVLIPGIALVSCGGGQRAAGPAPGTTRASSSSAVESPAGTATPASSQSAFCADLDTFNAALLRYAAEVGKAIDDKPVDFEEARRVARLVAQLGKGMKDSVPPDIADAFHLQLKAVRVSSSKLSTRNSAFDVVDPVYNKRATAARKALNEYECD